MLHRMRRDESNAETRDHGLLDRSCFPFPWQSEVTYPPMELGLSGLQASLTGERRRSATLAGIPVIIITKSLYFGDDSFEGAVAVVDDLDRLA